MNRLCTAALALASSILLCGSPAPVRAAAARNPVIVTPARASWAEKLAAREVRRYLYLRAGQLLPLRTEAEAGGADSCIVVARRDQPLARRVASSAGVESTLASLAPQEYWLRSVSARLDASAKATHRRHPVLLLAGGDDTGTLYAAYRFAEVLGVRFYLHGDLLPDEPLAWNWPNLDERATPLFALRGIQPFHDFPEGPDWWNRDDYLAIIGQLPKLRMNFFALHTYPEDRPNAEPTVWIGLPGDVGDQGRVRFSYPSSYQSTLRGNWGYAPRRTSDYLFGSALLFEHDNFGPDVMAGHLPAPDRFEACNEIFERSANLLYDAFRFARQLGVKTCVGTETPLIVPKRVQEHLKAQGKNPRDSLVVQELYAGIFRRAAQAYPLDYYWFWTPESWTWSGTKDTDLAATTSDLFAAITAHQEVQPPFALATCGWVLGPQQDRALFDKVLPKNIAVSCINREVGYTPVEPGFADVRGRSKWAIPWLEDDPALTVPQLWVARMRRDAADALRYGCDGLMGIHWRTRALGPNIAALAQAAWSQLGWSNSYHSPKAISGRPHQPGPVGGQVASFPANPILGTTETPLYRTVRYNLSAYHLPASNGLCRVILKFCEPHYAEAGKRVFDVQLQGQTVLTNLDIFARVGQNHALDFTFTNVPVVDGWLDIGFVPRVEFPSIAALVVDGPGFIHKINCAGPAYLDYAADWPAPPPTMLVLPTAKDFYQDWARAEFGPEAGPEAALIFARMDSALPKPATWVDGPGGIKPDPRPWEQVQVDYAFVNEFAALQTRVRGAGCQERFGYWLDSFRYLRAIGELNCAWGAYNRILEQVQQEADPLQRQQRAVELAMPARQKVVRALEVVYRHLLATVSTPGELGSLANWNQHNVPPLLLKPGEELARLLGKPLPAELQPGREYRGATRLLVPTQRGSRFQGESLRLRVLVLSEHPPARTYLFWRQLGGRDFAQAPLEAVGRGVYSGVLPGHVQDDIEYYVKAEPLDGPPIFYPPTAPHLNQTVVLCETN